MDFNFDASTYEYAQIAPSEVPRGVWFDVPDRHAGQAVEVAYGHRDRRSRPDRGSQYKRVHDRSLGNGPQAYKYYVREDL